MSKISSEKKSFVIGWKSIYGHFEQCGTLKGNAMQTTRNGEYNLLHSFAVFDALKYKCLANWLLLLRGVVLGTAWSRDFRVFSSFPQPSVFKHTRTQSGWISSRFLRLLKDFLRISQALCACLMQSRLANWLLLLGNNFPEWVSRYSSNMIIALQAHAFRYKNTRYAKEHSVALEAKLDSV